MIYVLVFLVTFLVLCVVWAITPDERSETFAADATWDGVSTYNGGPTP
jgi:hypothetical protein